MMCGGNELWESGFSPVRADRTVISMFGQTLVVFPVHLKMGTVSPRRTSRTVDD